MNRRNFLKALGFGSSASALSACSWDDNRYYTPVEQLLPYVVRPEQVTPGTPTYFATSVLSGPDAYPALAVHREGRVINIQANRLAPADPAISGAAFFELQRHYAPDRRKGPTAGGAPVTWEAGLGQLTEAMRAARAAGKKVAYLGPYHTGSLAALIDRVTGGDALFWEPLGREAEALAAQQLFGSRALPRYDIERAHYVLSFGAEFLGGNWGGAWSQAAFARARNANLGKFVARFGLVSPQRGQAGANADDWHVVTPGSEALVALAVARLVAEKRGYSGPALSLVQAGDPARAAAAAGIDAGAIEGIATLFAAAPAIALPGGVAGASAVAAELAAAVYLLNLVSGHDLFHAGGYSGPVHAYADLEKLVEEMKAGQVGVLLLGEVNPVHALPPGAGFAAALSSVGTVVSFSSHVDETHAKASLVLPTSDAFEDWGDEEPVQGFHMIRQPASSPLNDTRSFGDILLAVWRALDAAGAPTGTWRDFVEARWRGTLWPTQAFWDEIGGMDRPVPPARLQAFLNPAAAEAQPTPAKPTTLTPEEAAAKAHAEDLAFERWWESRLAAGFYLHPVAHSRTAPGITGGASFSDAPALEGGDLFLLVTPHARVGDGRYADQPWAQEIADPLTGLVWDSWALIHPDTAAKLGLADNDRISVTSPSGAIEVGVEIQPLVHPGAIAIAFGQGHTEAGRYANGIGANVATLLAPTKGSGGALALQQTKVAVKATGQKHGLASTFGADIDHDRNFAVRVSAAKLAAQGDAESHHPGELTGIHHLAMDARLVSKGIGSFYPEPDHPTYRFALTIDTDACTGCGACMVACAAENNLPNVGKVKVAEGRESAWLRINRYYRDGEIHFVPMLCQQCGHAPCESVCPVLATYHTIDGLNAMIYNRCVGTRYCSNACPYSARRFNFHTYNWPEPLNLQLNPDVVTRTMGVMEKCTFCVQRIRRIKSAYRDQGFTTSVPDSALRQLTACADACPSQALTFGNRNDHESVPYQTSRSGRNYTALPELNTFPAINYLAKASFHHDPTEGGHGGGAREPAGADHGGPAAKAPAEGH